MYVYVYVCMCVSVGSLQNGALPLMCCDGCAAGSGASRQENTRRHFDQPIIHLYHLLHTHTPRVSHTPTHTHTHPLQVFRAIGNGDMTALTRLIGDGDPFDPNAEDILFQNMENQVEITRKVCMCAM